MAKHTTSAAEPKTCSCGLTHDATAWAALPYVGVMADEHEPLELRNCSGCNSTLAVPRCIVLGCPERATWAREDRSLVQYCDEHINEWLTAEASIERREPEAA